jgi:hypothetical protein
MRADWERLAITVARTSVFLVNLGFWIGSLWGNSLIWLAHPLMDGISPDGVPYHLGGLGTEAATALDACVLLLVFAIALCNSTTALKPEPPRLFQADAAA